MMTMREDSCSSDLLHTPDVRLGTKESAQSGLKLLV